VGGAVLHLTAALRSSAPNNSLVYWTLGHVAVLYYHGVSWFNIISSIIVVNIIIGILI
jgi:hypothetical protein